MELLSNTTHTIAARNRYLESNGFRSLEEAVRQLSQAKEVKYNPAAFTQPVNDIIKDLAQIWSCGGDNTRLDWVSTVISTAKSVIIFSPRDCYVTAEEIPTAMLIRICSNTLLVYEPSTIESRNSQKIITFKEHRFASEDMVEFFNSKKLTSTRLAPAKSLTVLADDMSELTAKFIAEQHKHKEQMQQMMEQFSATATQVHERIDDIATTEATFKQRIIGMIELL